MNPSEAPTGGDIDRLLSEFFRRERPDPWPATPSVGGDRVTRPNAARRRAIWSGRWALVASLGTFAVLGLALARQMPSPVSGPIQPVEDGKAALPKALRGR